MLTDGVRVEIKNPTYAREGVWPVFLVGEQPLHRLVEDPSATIGRGEAVLFNAIEGILKDGSHEPLLGCRVPLQSDDSGRQRGDARRHADERPAHPEKVRV